MVRGFGRKPAPAAKMPRCPQSKLVAMCPCSDFRTSIAASSCHRTRQEFTFYSNQISAVATSSQVIITWVRDWAATAIDQYQTWHFLMRTFHFVRTPLVASQRLHIYMPWTTSSYCPLGSHTVWETTSFALVQTAEREIYRHSDIARIAWSRKTSWDSDTGIACFFVSDYA